MFRFSAPFGHSPAKARANRGHRGAHIYAFKTSDTNVINLCERYDTNETFSYLINTIVALEATVF